MIEGMTWSGRPCRPRHAAPCCGIRRASCARRGRRRAQAGRRARAALVVWSHLV